MCVRVRMWVGVSTHVNVCVCSFKRINASTLTHIGIPEATANHGVIVQEVELVCEAGVVGDIVNGAQGGEAHEERVNPPPIVDLAAVSEHIHDLDAVCNKREVVCQLVQLGVCLAVAVVVCSRLLGQRGWVVARFPLVGVAPLERQLVVCLVSTKEEVGHVSFAQKEN